MKAEMRTRMWAAGALLIVAIVASACVGQVTPPPTAEPTPQPEPTATPHWQQGELAVFFGDADVTGQVDEAGGQRFEFTQGDTVMVYLNVPNDKLSDDAGVVYLVPRAAQDLFEFAGMGPFVRGAAEIGLPRADASFPGWCQWNTSALDQHAIEFRYLDGETDRRVIGQANNQDQPPHFYYGLRLACTIEAP